jgi:uncharacterized protein (TIGR02466 family)
MIQHFTFAETVGIYNGDQSIVDSTITYIYELKHKYPESDGNSNYGGWQKQLDHPIKHVIEKEFKEYLKWYCVEEPKWIAFTNLFCNVNPPGSSNVMHHHNIGEFSGVLWLQAENNSGNIVIMNPFYNRFMNTCVNSPEKDYNAMYITPEANKGAFFNSNLVHYVDINRSQIDRISIGYHLGIHY